MSSIKERVEDLGLDFYQEPGETREKHAVYTEDESFAAVSLTSRSFMGTFGSTTSTDLYLLSEDDKKLVYSGGSFYIVTDIEKRDDEIHIETRGAKGSRRSRGRKFCVDLS